MQRTYRPAAVNELAPVAGRPGSCWVASASRTGFPQLSGSLSTETVVVGGGIVGLTVALRLAEMARPVVVLDGLRIGGQVTGRSTAKITTQHALIYRHLSTAYGRTRAKEYADANLSGAGRIRDWISDYRIPCDFATRAAYAYTIDEDRRQDIADEAEAARAAGLDAEVVESAPLPFKTAGALRFPNQAQFNPAQYLVGLADAVATRDGQIFEESRAVEIDSGDRWRVSTATGSVEAAHLFIATNMTVKSPLGMASRTQPRSHPVMAFRIEHEDHFDGMFISIDEPTRSLRTGHDADGPLLVVLGPKFNTGQDGDVASRFFELEQWARTQLPVGDALWHWCNEDYDTPDRVPYIGTPDPAKAPGFHIATGFNAWGITNGTAAGMLIVDLILGRPNPWQVLYDPARPTPKGFHRDGDSQSLVASLEEIGRDQGGIIVKDGERIAVWRDATGQLTTLSAKCTHKGCTVTWNNADKTWDCPCHGSIHAGDGSIIHGPAREPLAPRVLT